MFKNKNVKDLILVVGLLVFSRLIPHWPNMTALGAVAILAPRWYKQSVFALVIPLIALLVSDVILGFHSTMVFTYLSVFVVSYLSWKSARQESPLEGLEFLGLGLSSSAIFFIFTNFGSWLMMDLYSKDLAGLVQSYWNAIPFLGFELLGTFVYMSLGLAVRHRLRGDGAHSVGISFK